MCAFPVCTAQALGCSAGNCLMLALGCMHSPGLTAAQVQVLGYSTKVQTWLGLRFVPILGPSSSGGQVLGEHSCPQLKAATYRLPHPSCSVFWVYNSCTFSGVPCVSFGELISGCDPPSRCRPSRIPRNFVWQRSLLAVCYRMPLWGRDCPFPALAALQQGMGRSAAG